MNLRLVKSQIIDYLDFGDGNGPQPVYPAAHAFARRIWERLPVDPIWMHNAQAVYDDIVSEIEEFVGIHTKPEIAHGGATIN